MAIEIASVRFRRRGGRFQLEVPKGSRLLCVYQHANSYWYADLAAPVGESATEMIDMCLINGKETADLDLDRWAMVGQATSLQGRASYVFHKQADPAPKKRPSKPKKPPVVPPVDTDQLPRL